MEGRTHTLITGRPGVGKTTLIRTLAERFIRHHPAGFYTQEIQVNGVRKGFQLVSLDGREQILSHVNHRGPYRIGRYGVDVEGIERLLTELDLSHSPSRLIIIDEIGKMECLSKQFIHEVETILDSPRTVIATVAQKGEGLIARVKKRPDCQVVTVTVENRERLANELLPKVLESFENSKEEDKAIPEISR